VIFQYCPRCKSEKVLYDGLKGYSCDDCGWLFFQNVATAVGVIMEYKDKLLFVVRNKDPQKGKLDLPGGFLDPGESIEQAAKREIREEIGIAIDKLEYFGSYPSIYEYEGIPYNTCDVILVTRISNLPTDFSEEVKEIKVLKPEEINLNKIAFESVGSAVSAYLRNKL